MAVFSLKGGLKVPGSEKRFHIEEHIVMNLSHGTTVRT